TKTKLFNEEGTRTVPDTAVRLNTCLQASGVQTKPRNAHVNVNRDHHGAPNIGSIYTASIAAKPRTWQGKTRHDTRFGCSSLAARQPANAAQSHPWHSRHAKIV